MTTFKAPEEKKKRISKTWEKGEHAGDQHFLLPSYDFYHMEDKFIFLITSNLSSVNAFKLDKTKFFIVWSRVHRVRENVGI